MRIRARNDCDESGRFIYCSLVGLGVGHEYVSIVLSVKFYEVDKGEREL